MAPGGARLICGLNGSPVINFQSAGWVKRAATTDQDIVFHLGSNLGNSNATTPTADITLGFNSGANTLSLKNYSNASLTATPDVNITATASAAAWHHFATPDNSGSAADSQDPDGDGLSNAREYVMGTVPSQPDSGPPLVVSSAGQGITLTFIARQATGAGYAGLTRRYTVESTSDLANPGLWEALTGYSNVVGEGQTVTLTPSAGGNRCFYRLRITLE